MRFVILTGGLFRAWGEAFIQNRDGHLNTESWEAVTRHYVLIMGAPGIRRVWQMRKGGFGAQFQIYADAIDIADYNYR